MQPSSIPILTTSALSHFESVVKFECLSTETATRGWPRYRNGNSASEAVAHIDRSMYGAVTPWWAVRYSLLNSQCCVVGLKRISTITYSESPLCPSAPQSL